MKKRNRSITYQVKKYYRFMRLYLLRVRQVEKEIGGEIVPC